MSFTEHEMEAMRLHLKTAGFEVPEDWDDDRLGNMAACILESLGIEHE